jgi:hypothetical protein
MFDFVRDSEGCGLRDGSRGRSEPALLGLIEIDLGNRLRIPVDAQVDADVLARALRLARRIIPQMVDCNGTI